MKRIALIGLAVAGCAQTPPQASTTLAPAGACRPEAVADLVGKPLTDALQTDARGKTGAATVRVLGPGTMATMDYRPDRLNIDIDDRSIVRRVRCG